MPKNVKFPLCSKYGLETLDFGNVSGTHYISFSDQVELSLAKAEKSGTLAERERILEKAEEFYVAPKSQGLSRFVVFYQWLRFRKQEAELSK